MSNWTSKENIEKLNSRRILQMTKEKERKLVENMVKRFNNAKDEKERIKIIFHTCRVAAIPNFVSPEDKKLVYQMVEDYFLPKNADGKLDVEKQQIRLTEYNTWSIDIRIEFGKKVEEYKAQLDKKYPNAGVDFKDRDNNLMLAIMYAKYSPEQRIILDDLEIRRQLYFFVQGSASHEVYMALDKNCNQILEQKMNDPVLKRQYEYSKYEDIESPYVQKMLDKDIVEKEAQAYLTEIVSSGFGKAYLGDREFDAKNRERYRLWHEIRNNTQLTEAMQTISDNKRGNHENSEDYQNIIESYKSACDAKNPEEFITRMESLRTVAREYISKKNPHTTAGKERLRIVKELDTLLTETIFPVMDEKIVDKDPEFEDEYMVQAKKAALDYTLQNDAEYINAGTTEIKNREHERIEKSVNDGSNEVLKFILAQPRDIALLMMEQASGKDTKKFTDNYRIYKELQDSISSHRHPTNRNLEGMFDATIDGSNMRSLFKDDNGKYVENDEITRAQKEAEDIILPKPDDMSKSIRQVGLVTLSFLATDENMKDFHERATDSKGSTAFKSMDAVEGGYGNLIENLLTKQDPRANMHIPRLYLPEARRKAAEALTLYQKKDYAAVVTSMKACFDKMLGNARSIQNITSNQRAVAAEYARDMYAFLSNEKFKDLVTFTEEEKQYVELLRAESQLVKNMLKLKSDILKHIQEKAFKEEYLGIQAEETPADSEWLEEKYREYQAYQIYFSRCYEANKLYDDGLSAKYASDNAAETATIVTREKLKRPISRCQKNMMLNPEKYIDYLKGEVRRSSNPNMLPVLKAKTWKEAADKLYTSSVTEKPVNVEDAENLLLPGLIAIAIKKFPDTKQAKDIIKELNSLPCNTPTNGYLTAKEMSDRVEAYERMQRLMGSIKAPYEIKLGQNDGSNVIINADAADDIKEALTNQINRLKTCAIMNERENGYERAMAKNKAEHDYTVGEEELAKLDGKYLFDRPTRDDWREDIIKLIDDATKKGLVDSQSTTVKSILKEVKTSNEDIPFMEGYGENQYSNMRFLNVYAEALDSDIRELEDKMIDDDSEETLNQYTFLTKLATMVDGYITAKDPLEDETSVHAAIYNKAKERIKEIERVIEKTNGEDYPQFFKLAQLAKGSMDKIRKTIMHEAFGDKEDDIPITFDKIVEADDLAILSNYYALVYLKEDSHSRVIFEKSGMDLFVYKTDSSQKMKALKERLDVVELNKMLDGPKQFNSFLIKEEIGNVAEQAPQQEPQVEQQNPEIGAMRNNSI